MWESLFPRGASRQCPGAFALHTVHTPPPCTTDYPVRDACRWYPPVLFVPQPTELCTGSVIGSVGFKEVRGSFAILFWLPCVTWHRVMTHTHHTQSFRSTDAFLRHSTPGPISEVSWGFLLHPSGLSFGFQARCTGPLERTKDVDFRRVQLSTEWCLKARNGSGGNVDDVYRSTSRRVGAWSIFRTSPELFSAVVSVIFSFFVLVDLGNEQSFVTEEVDSSPRLLLEQTTSAPRCRSGECIHNQPFSISLAVLYFNLHFRCLALMH